MKIKIIIALIILFQLVPLKAWALCKNFFDFYHFTVFDLELQLIYAINHDQELPVLLARTFHNKLLQFFIDVYKRYTHFLDPQLLITLLTFVGVLGVLLAIWYFLNSKKKNRKVFLLIILSFLIPLIDVIFNLSFPFIFKLLLVAIPFNILSVYGHMKFLDSGNKKLVYVTYFILILLSVYWMISIPDQALKYCEMP